MLVNSRPCVSPTAGSAAAVRGVRVQRVVRSAVHALGSVQALGGAAQLLRPTAGRRAARPCRRGAGAAPGPRAALELAALSVGWLMAGAAAVGVVMGLTIAKMMQNFFASQLDPRKANKENALLRAKVDELQQMVTKFEPMAYRSLRLRFTKGVNKAVILGLVDELLSNKEVNIWWLPDNLERLLYFNVISLMLSVMDEVVEGMSINFAGHNVKLQLTYLDLDSENAGGAAVSNPARPAAAAGGSGKLLPSF